GRQKGEAVAFCSKEERPLLQDIEAYIGQPITVLEIDGTAYEDTLLQSEDTASQSLKELMNEIESFEQNKGKQRKNRKRK
ncbi:MAG: ATP-dependent helicase, partial [Bacteroidota bacterium]